MTWPFTSYHMYEAIPRRLGRVGNFDGDITLLCEKRVY